MKFNQADIDTIINILEENENSIEEDYNQKDDLIAIGYELKTKIFSAIGGDDINNKELVRYAVKEAFELENRDIIVIQKNKIIIKLLDDESIHEIQEKDIGTIASRYNGINKEDLKSFYDDIFAKEEPEYFFDSVAESFVRTHLLGKHLNNKAYEENVFSMVQAIVSNKLINRFDHHEEFFKGFSGYIFRIHFKEVFEYISELLLVELSKSNSYIIDFMKYYSLRVVILNGKKYDVPEIIEENGFKWNVASLMPVIKVYIKSVQSFDRLEKELNSLGNKLADLNISGVTPVSYNHTINSQLKSLTQNISEDMAKLDRHIVVLKDKPHDVQLKNEILDIKSFINSMREKKEQLSNKVLSRGVVTKYTDLKREADSILRQLKREEVTIEKNEKQFISIKNALTKALTSKKKLAT